LEWYNTENGIATKDYTVGIWLMWVSGPIEIFFGLGSGWVFGATFRDNPGAQTHPYTVFILMEWPFH